MFSVGKTNAPTRKNWIARKLKEIPAGLRILDAGAGEQPFKESCAHLRYVSQDFAQYDGTGDASGIQMGTWDQMRLDIVSDITQIPESDASFDAVMCTEVFEHIPDPVAAIQEFARLLRPNGYLLITAPFCSLTHFAPYHFYTGFTHYFYEKYLNENGFEILELEKNGNYFEFVAQEVRRINYVSNRYLKHKPSFFDKIFLHATNQLILFILNKYSKMDQTSSQLLCFGVFVLARKK